MFKQTQTMLAQIKQQKPLILNLTNPVTMDFVANGLLAVGASPVMSQSLHDIEELLPMVAAVVINIGTLDDTFYALAEATCRLANQLKKPIILDPVGAGATHYRTSHARRLLDSYDIAIIRGNASEMMALSGEATSSKGVDSLAQSTDAIASASSLSKQSNACIIVSGAVDIILDGTQVAQLHCGSAIMPHVVGTGCLLSAVVAAFHAVETSAWLASHASVLLYGICGEIAEQHSSKPGSFKVHFVDALYTMPTEEYYANR